MERDFELELKELAQKETPDLWNRIEAGLSERDIPGKRIAWKKWSMLAAACFCGVILFPVMMRRLTGTLKSGSTDASMEAACDEDKMNAAPAKESAEAGTSADGWMSGAAENASSAAGEIAEESESVASDEPNAELELKTFELTDGQVFEEITVQILETDIFGEEVLYQARILQADDDAILKSDMQIWIICDDKSEYTFPRGTRDESALRTGENYLVTLRYEEDEVLESVGDYVFYAVTVDAVEE